MLAILGLFSDAKVEINPEEVAGLLKCSRATAYRYLKALSDAGVLAAVGSGELVLGPKVIELERLIRRNDPLLTTARPVMESLNARLGANVMLCSYYGNQVLLADAIWCTTENRHDYERGRPMSMFLGAMAKVILANVSPYQRRSLMLNHQGEIKKAGLGDDWAEFNANMHRIRKERVCVTRAEVVSNLVGVAAPVFAPDRRVVGSLTLALPTERWELGHEQDSLRDAVINAASNVTDALSDLRRSKLE
jgi:DNA-binding IclR family transcriptional regulator